MIYQIARDRSEYIKDVKGEVVTKDGDGSLLTKREAV